MAERPEWIEKQTVVPLVAMTVAERFPPLDHSLFANGHSIMDFARTEAHRNIIRKINTTNRLGGTIALLQGLLRVSKEFWSRGF